MEDQGHALTATERQAVLKTVAQLLLEASAAEMAEASNDDE